MRRRLSLPERRPIAPPQRLDRVAFVAVGVLALTITWNGLRGPGGAFANVFLGLAVLAVLAHVVVDRRTIPIAPWLLVSAGGMIVAALVTSMFPPDPTIHSRTLLQFNQAALTAGVPLGGLVQSRSNVSALVKWQTGLVVVPVLMVLVATNTWRIHRLLDLWTVGAVVSAFVGILDRAGVHALAPVAIAGNRSAGLAIHPNYLALTCAFAIPVALRWIGRSDRATVAGLAATVILLGGEYSTGSRDGNVAAVVGLVLTVALVPRLQPGLRFVLPIVGILAVAMLAFTHAGHSILDQLRLNGPTASTNGSGYQRAVARQVAEAQIAARPISGVGMSVDNDAQNIYLQILAAGGVILMASFLVFVGGLASCVRRALGGPLHQEAIVLGVCMLVWLINGYYDSQIADKYLYVLPGILMACAYVSSAHAAAVPADTAAVASVPARVPALEPSVSGS